MENSKIEMVDKEIMKKTNQQFLERRNEIKGIINEQENVCPHFANDI